MGAGGNDRGEPALLLQKKRLSLRNSWFKTAGKFTDRFRGIYGIYLNLMKENRRMLICNRLDLQTLDFDRLCPKISPITGLG